MRHFATVARRAGLHIAGLLLLLLAIAIGRVLVEIGIGRSGHEPASAYGLALLAFLLASAGAALTAMGPSLFGKVIVAGRWHPHVPAAFREDQKETPVPSDRDSKNIAKL